jgi:hypothetical protein
MKLDNDIVIHDRHWFPILWNYMKKAPRTAVWGADFHNQLDNPVLVKERQGLTGKTRGHVSGGAVLIPRDISDYIGYWCEDYGLYGCEDGDYGMRLTSEDIDQYYYDHHPFMKHMGDDWQDMKNRHGLNKTDERSKSYPLWLTNRWLLTHDYRSVNFPAAYVPADFDGYVLRLEPNRHYINIFKAWTRFHELCMLADRMQEDWRNTPPLVGEMLNALNALISVQNRDWNAAVLEADNAYHAVRRRLGSSHPL